MAVYKLARFAVRPETRADAERAMFALTDKIRAQLPHASWTLFRDPDEPTSYTAMIRLERAGDDGGALLVELLGPHLAGDVAYTGCELVTSSDLAPRHRERRR